MSICSIVGATPSSNPVQGLFHPLPFASIIFLSCYKSPLSILVGSGVKVQVGTLLALSFLLQREGILTDTWEGHSCVRGAASKARASDGWERQIIKSLNQMPTCMDHAGDFPNVTSIVFPQAEDNCLIS